MESRWLHLSEKKNDSIYKIATMRELEVFTVG